jgi:hypothetical protein
MACKRIPRLLLLDWKNVMRQTSCELAALLDLGAVWKLPARTALAHACPAESELA